MKIGLLSRSPIGNNFGKQNSGKVEVQKGFEQNNNMESISSSVSSPKLLEAYFVSKKNVSFGGTKSNYLVYDETKEGLVPVVVEPGIKLKHYSDSSGGGYPKFKIQNADFTGGDLAKCYMKGSEIINCNLTDTDMERIHLHESKLNNSNFERAFAFESVFKYSDFSGANLTDIDARRSNFQNCNFANANMDYGDFKRCNFMGADLSKAKNLDTATLTFAVYDENTKFPPGFDTYDLVKFEKGTDLRGVYIAPETVRKGSCSAYDPTNNFANMTFGVYDGYTDEPNTKFDRCNFSHLQLDKCKFDGINATGTSFAQCSLWGTEFKDCILDKTDFHGMMNDECTKFTGETSLKGANLIDTNLYYSGIEKLEGDKPLENALYTVGTVFPKDFNPEQAGMKLLGANANLENHDFEGMSFSEDATGERAILSLENANFKRCNFSRTDLCNLNMKGANFTEAYLRDAQLINANCEGANFLDAQMYDINLAGANMRNTNLTWAKMQGMTFDEKTDFTGARYNDDTRFPMDFPESIKKTMTYIPRKMAKGF